VAGAAQQRPQQLAVGSRVVHHQHPERSAPPRAPPRPAPASRPARAAARTRRCCLARARPRPRSGRPSARPAGARSRAPAPCRREGWPPLVQPAEWLEQPLPQPRRDPGPGVTDREAQDRAPAPAPRRGHLQPDPAAVGELGRVREQVRPAPA
jgi:hypothetical protein